MLLWSPTLFLTTHSYQHVNAVERCVYMLVCVYACVCICLCVCVCITTCLYVYVYTCLCTYEPIHTHTHNTHNTHNPIYAHTPSPSITHPPPSHPHLKTKVDRANEVYRMMKRHEQATNSTRVTPNTITMNTLINASAKAGRYEEAVGRLDELTGKGVQPDAFTLSALMTACDRGERYVYVCRGGVRGGGYGGGDVYVCGDMVGDVYVCGDMVGDVYVCGALYMLWGNHMYMYTTHTL